MAKYAVDLAKYWHYAVEAKDKVEAEEIAYQIYCRDEGEGARYDDCVITCLIPDEEGSTNDD